MATKAEELVDGCFAHAADDEPLFVLRAKDVLAPDIVRQWAARAASAGSPDRKVVEALELADRMEAWQIEHSKKVPD